MGHIRSRTLPGLRAAGWVFALGLVACSAAAPVRSGASPASSAAAADPAAATVAAEMALEHGDCRGAAEDYAAASVGAPAALARRATEVAFDCENVPAAWTAAQNWVKAAPTDREAGIVYATVALKLYRPDVARAALATAFKSGTPPSDSDLVGFLSALTEEADASAVLAAVGDLLDTPQASPKLLTALAALAISAYDFGRADHFVHEALQRDPHSPEALRGQARLAVLRGDADAAIRDAHEVMRADVTDGTFELAEVLADLGRTQDARAELERLRATGDIVPGEIDRRLAILAFDSGDFTDAQKRFTDLIDHGEAGDGAVFYLAQIAASTGHKDAALAMYRRLADSSMGPQARLEAAGLLLDENKRAEAFALLDDAAGHDPRSTFELLLDKARLLADHGDAEGAVALLDAGLAAYPQNPTLQYERATALERAGHTHESVQSFEQLLSARPTDPTVLNALGYTLADHHLQLARAEKLIRKALETTPDSPAALDSLGWVRVRRGDAHAAVPILQHAYSLGQDPDIAAHWGEALWLTGAQSEARKVWSDALALHPDSTEIKSTQQRLAPPGHH
ncbi:MAG TPA: tetratricopeptide repeat protein [Steroidobacteraceae bacterium]|nr:tetratricopeptide repeat protein [Steroidobacteraceae bacterium]